ncbi:MAG: O-antigen ligase family protein, partial [Desulfofustis sp.]
MSPAANSNLAQKAETAAAVCLCLACFFTPLSTTLLGIFSVLAAGAWLLSGGLLDLPHIFKSNPSTLVALLLFLMMAASLTYAPVPILDGLMVLRKYRELLLMPVVFSLLSHAGKYRTSAQNCFLAGSAALMLISYLIFFGLLSEDHYGHSLVFHITHSFFMAVLGYWTLHRATAPGKYRYRIVSALISLAAVINLFYVAPGRTGMFIFCCLILLFLYQRLSLSKWLVGIIVFMLLLAGTYQTSENFSGRVTEALNEIVNYKQGQSRTSIGQRFDWWTIGIELFAEKPVLGHGVGSYGVAHRRATSGTAIKATDNPHNEYIFLAVQLGIIGLILFLLIFLLQIQESKSISKTDRQILHGVLLSMLAGCLMNSLLFDSQQGHFYLLMSAALLAGK